MIDWQAVPMLFVVRPACPACGSTKHIRVRSFTEGDGSTTRRVVCSKCSEPFLLIIENPPLPESGNWKSDDC